MGASAWLTGHRLRHRWLGTLPIAVLAAIGATATLAAVGAAERTGTAYTRYVASADVGEVVLNPVTFTADIDAVIRALPGVRAVASDAGFSATLDDGAPRPRRAIDADPTRLLVRGSDEGRFVDVDRPALAEGRLADGRQEAVVSVETARARQLAIGDEIEVAFWQSRDDPRMDAGPVDPDEVVAPAGVERLRVVGIATLPDEVLPDDLFPRRRVIVSPDVARRYDCLPEVPTGDPTLEAAALALFPDGCSTVYRFYSLRIDGGARQVGLALDSFVRSATELNEALAPVLREDGPLYYLVAITRQHEQDRVEHSTGPTVVGLATLGGVALLVTTSLLWLAAARELRRAEPELLQWWQLGFGARARVAAVVVPLLSAIAAGLLVALVAAWALSPVGPVGNVSSIEPRPDRVVTGWALLCWAALALLVGLGVLALATAADRRARPRAADPVRTSSLALLASQAGPPVVAEGIRAAVGRRDARLVVATAGTALGTFVAAIVFGASLTRAVTTPATYGWPWDVGVVTGLGYGSIDLATADATLGPRDDVRGWSALSFTNSVTVAGEPVVAVISADHRSDVELPVVEGRLPARAGEIAVGTHSAAALGIEVDDEVEVVGHLLAPTPATTSTVTGIVVLPPLGPFESDRASPGTGLLLPAAAVDPGTLAQTIGFVGIDLAPGADPEAALESMAPDIAAWDRTGFAPFTYTEAVRPPEIIDADALQVLPLLVATIVVAAATVGLSIAAMVSVRGRRPDLAVLRALGFTGRQLRGTVLVQQLVVMAVALAVGLPLGVAVGRVAWQGFADQLGIVPEPAVPLSGIGATLLGAGVVAVIVSIGPGRAVVRARPGPNRRRE